MLSSSAQKPSWAHLFTKHLPALALVPALALFVAGCSDDDDDDDSPSGPEEHVPGDVDGVGSLYIQQIGRFVHATEWDEGAAEIVTFDASNEQIFVTNAETDSVDVLDAADPTDLALIESIDFTADEEDAGGPNSVAVHGDLVAVAIEHDDKQENGWIMFYDAVDFDFVKSVEVGALPDMVTFSPDGSMVIVANEGEPNDDYTVDPVGSISVIAIDAGVPADTATTLGFEDYNEGGDRADELPAGVRIFGNFGHTKLTVTAINDDADEITVSDATGIAAGQWMTIFGDDDDLEDGEALPYQVASVSGNVVTLTDGLDDEATYNDATTALADLTVSLHDGASSVAQDLEPEYIAVSGDSNYAFVACQENNALVVVDLEDMAIEGIVALGTKDHSLAGNELDVSDKDDIVNITNWPVHGLYMPDTIAAYTVGGDTYIVTANEGDGRAYEGFNEEIRFQDASLGVIDGVDFDDSDGVGRLLTTVTNDSDSDGNFDTFHSFGARSFSIWDDDGTLVYDSGREFAAITANRYGIKFNNNNDKTVDDADTRSDAKGCEPEALAVGQVGDKWYAFIGLERMGGIMIYDITDPEDATFVDYINNRNINAEEPGDDETLADTDPDGDYGPEGFDFVSASDSPTGKALLIVGSEISGSTTVYEIGDFTTNALDPAPMTAN